MEKILHRNEITVPHKAKSGGLKYIDNSNNLSVLDIGICATKKIIKYNAPLQFKPNSTTLKNSITPNLYKLFKTKNELVVVRLYFALILTEQEHIWCKTNCSRNNAIHLLQTR